MMVLGWEGQTRYPRIKAGMAGYFDEEEEELDAGEPSRDTVVTLSWGAVVGMGLALLLICGLCFGLGYMVGRRGSAPGAATGSASQPGAPDQEPLQGSGSVPKPSASAQAPVEPPETSAAENPALPATAAGESPEAVAPSPSQQLQSGASQSQGSLPAATAPPLVRPALPDNSPESASPQVRPALPPAATLMVQVAAVKNADDANVLTDALRKRGYPVSARREPVDGLIHVRVGPFASRDEAYRWRDKLLDDGYNAVVQP